MRHVFHALIALALAFGLIQSSLAEEPDEADIVVRNYLAEIAANLCVAEPKNPSERQAVLAVFDKIGQSHLLKFKDVLHKKAIRDFLKMDLWKPAAGIKSRQIFADDGRLIDLQGLYKKELYGKPPFDKNSFAATWWEPHAPAKFLRDMAFLQVIGDDLAEKRKFMDTLVPPKCYRLNDDPEKPVIAAYDGRELFVVHLEYFSAGVYALVKFEWFAIEKEK